MDRHDDAEPGHADDSEPAANTRGDPDLDARPQRVGRRVRSIEAAAIAGGIYAVLAVVAVSLLSRYPSLDQTDDASPPGSTTPPISRR